MARYNATINKYLILEDFREVERYTHKGTALSRLDELKKNNPNKLYEIKRKKGN